MAVKEAASRRSPAGDVGCDRATHALTHGGPEPGLQPVWGREIARGRAILTPLWPIAISVELPSQVFGATSAEWRPRNGLWPGVPGWDGFPRLRGSAGHGADGPGFRRNQMNWRDFHWPGHNDAGRGAPQNPSPLPLRIGYAPIRKRLLRRRCPRTPVVEAMAIALVR